MAEDDDQSKPEIYLKVEKTADGYIEQDELGGKHQHYRIRDPRLTIQGIHLVSTIDVRSGEKRMAILGYTRETFRAIGTTGEGTPLSAKIAAGEQPGTAVILKRYLLRGDLAEATLSINVSDVALSSMVDELTRAKSPRAISAAVRQGAFFSFAPDSVENLVLLPWVEEQRRSKTSEDITVEFPLSIAELTVDPENAWAGDFGDKTVRAQRVEASGPLGIYYSKSEHPLQSTLQEATTELSSLRSILTTLVVSVVIGLVLLVFHYWK